MKLSFEELQKKPYEELCLMADNGEITWSEWIDLNEPNYSGYDRWLAEKGWKRSDKAAKMYISLCEEQMMDNTLFEEAIAHIK